jgi:hypothetical protein
MHRRYHAKPPHQRPALDARSAAALLTVSERLALASCGYYPVPSVVVRLGCTPLEYQRDRILDAVADDLPEAVTAVLEALTS